MTASTATRPQTTQERGAEYLERAREVAKVIEAEANTIEAERTITRRVYEALAEADLFWGLIPTELGGAGLDIVSAFKIIQEITHADGSAGWAFMANAGSMGVAVGFTHPEGSKEMFGGAERGITAGMIVPTGKAFRVDGGYRVTGRFQFGSGSAHASWIGVGFVVHDDDGNPIIDEAGMPDARIGWTPRENVEFLGNWDVMGMVGTGSYDYQVTDLFVPDHLTMEVQSNGLIESVNTKIRLITRMAFGFRSPEALIALAMLNLGGHRPTLPGRQMTHG